MKKLFLTFLALLLLLSACSAPVAAPSAELSAGPTDAPAGEYAVPSPTPTGTAPATCGAS